MGFNFHIGLPGPFSYNYRLGGHKRSRKPSGPPPTGKDYLGGLGVIYGVAALVMWFTPVWPVALFMTLFPIVAIVVRKTSTRREWSKAKRGVSVTALALMFLGGFIGSIAAATSSSPAPAAGHSAPAPKSAPSSASSSKSAPKSYQFRDIDPELPAGIHVGSNWYLGTSGTYQEAFVTNSADSGSVNIVQWEANGTGKAAALTDLDGTPTASGHDWAYTDDATGDSGSQPASQPAQANPGYTWSGGHCRNSSTGEFAKNVDCGH